MGLSSWSPFHDARPRTASGRADWLARWHDDRRRLEAAVLLVVLLLVLVVLVVALLLLLVRGLRPIGLVLSPSHERRRECHRRHEDHEPKRFHRICIACRGANCLELRSPAARRSNCSPAPH